MWWFLRKNSLNSFWFCKRKKLTNVKRLVGLPVNIWCFKFCLLLQVVVLLKVKKVYKTPGVTFEQVVFEKKELEQVVVLRL